MDTRTPLVWYKDCQYKLLFRGPTKYGNRAKLGFLNSNNTFWVDSHLLSDAGPNAAPPPSPTKPPVAPSNKVRLARHYLKLLDPSTNASEGEKTIALERLRRFLDKMG